LQFIQFKQYNQWINSINQSIPFPKASKLFTGRVVRCSYQARLSHYTAHVNPWIVMLTLSWVHKTTRHSTDNGSRNKIWPKLINFRMYVSNNRQKSSGCVSNKSNERFLKPLALYYKITKIKMNWFSWAWFYRPNTTPYNGIKISNV
jgi:hypothetical protein